MYHERTCCCWLVARAAHVARAGSSEKRGLCVPAPRTRLGGSVLTDYNHKRETGRRMRIAGLDCRIGAGGRRCSWLVLSACATLLALAPVAAVEVGMMYEGWQGPAYWGRSHMDLT